MRFLNYEQQEQAKEIYGRLLSDPVYLINAVWDNNSNALLFAWQTEGLADVDSAKDIHDTMVQMVSQGQKTGLYFAELLAKIPYNPAAGNYTTTAPFEAAFEMFDFDMGVKPQYNG